jgi:hypothetical protein
MLFVAACAARAAVGAHVESLPLFYSPVLVGRTPTAHVLEAALCGSARSKFMDTEHNETCGHAASRFDMLEERDSCGSETSWSGLSTFLDTESNDDNNGEERRPADASQDGKLHEEHKAQIECRTTMTHEEFNAHYRHKRPVLLRGWANEWPALANWAEPAYLRNLLGDERKILVLRSPDGRRFLKRDCRQDMQPFSQVVDELLGPVASTAAPRVQGDIVTHKTAQGGISAERLYARAPLAEGLRAETPLDGLQTLVGGVPSNHEFRDDNCGVWLGSAGCITPLHYDLCHGFLVGVLGVKRITYYSPDDFGGLYAREQQPELSTVDLEAWREGEATEAGRAERAVHPRFAEATAWHCELHPGDILYTPPYHWHHVETAAEQAALSVLVPFDPAPDEPVHACHFR